MMHFNCIVVDFCGMPFEIDAQVTELDILKKIDEIGMVTQQTHDRAWSLKLVLKYS